jgi:hypothetical protein
MDLPTRNSIAVCSGLSAEDVKRVTADETQRAAAASTGDDGGPPAFFNHHPAAAFVVLEIGPIAFPCSGHAVMAERGLAMRHARVGRADHPVSAGDAHRERHVDERKAELQYVSHRDAGCPTLSWFLGSLHTCKPLLPSLAPNLALGFPARNRASTRAIRGAVIQPPLGPSTPTVPPCLRSRRHHLAQNSRKSTTKSRTLRGELTTSVSQSFAVRGGAGGQICSTE